MASAPTRTPTREQLEAALNLVLTHSVTATEAAARAGCSYTKLAKKPPPSFRVGRETRFWTIDIDEWSAR